jgi:hypothetical protein
MRLALKAFMLKIFGMIDFFFKEVTARTPSLILASFSSLEEIHVGPERLAVGSGAQ